MNWRRGRTARHLGLGVLVALALLGLGTAGQGALGELAAAQGIKDAGEITTLRLATFNSTPMALAVAVERGLLEAQGLRIERTFVESSQQLMRGVIDGTYDLAFTNPDNWMTYAVRDNADVFMFQGNDTGGDRVVVVRPEIQTVADLRGRTIAVDAVDSGLVMILWKILNDQGLDFRTGDPPLVPVGATGPRLASMERGETFAAIVSPQDVAGAEARGFRVIGRSSVSLPEYPGTQGGTSRRWAQAHLPELLRFIGANVAASEWSQNPANREEALALYMRYTSANRTIAEDAYATMQPDATINVEGTQTILNLRLALGFMEPPAPAIERFYDTRYWEAATGRRHP